MRRSAPRHAAGIALVAAGAMLNTGCVERRLSITSEPPGARVWINDTEAGVTPLEAEFTFHGVYDLRLERAGYAPLVTGAKADPPWWEFPPFDLVAELMPFTIRNEQQWHFELEPNERAQGLERLEAETLLLERAEALRELTNERQD